jgi:hypothetical protein
MTSCHGNRLVADIKARRMTPEVLRQDQQQYTRSPDIKGRRLKWLVNVSRISLRRKQIIKFVRSRLILLEYAEDDLREAKMKRWRKMLNNAVEYASLVT